MNCRKSLLLLMLLISLLGFGGCSSRLTLVNRYQYFDVGIDDIPPVEKVEAILVTAYYHPEIFYLENGIYVIGDPNKVEKIVGHDIFPRKVINDPAWISRIVSDFKSARREKIGTYSDARVVFITKQRAYMVLISMDDKIVYGDSNFTSSKLRQDFRELGIFEDTYGPGLTSEELIKYLRESRKEPNKQK